MVWVEADLACEDPTTPPPPPAPTNPSGLLETAMQLSADAGGVRVAGWAYDPDTMSPINVDIAVDGTHAVTVLANVDRPDINADYPHGFDAKVPVSVGPHRVCATGINVGPGHSASLGCLDMDRITGFEVNSVAYHLDRAVITNNNPDNVYGVTYNNGTSEIQRQNLSGSTTITDTDEWSRTTSASLTITGNLKVSIPFVVDNSISISAGGTYTYTENHTQSVANTWSWSTDVSVPAQSTVHASIIVTHSTVSVPYTLNGSYVWQSGQRVSGTIDGTFTGINAHNLNITTTQTANGTTSAPVVIYSAKTSSKR